jgi:hypothetical protein
MTEERRGALPQWTPPADFAEQCVVETLVQLAARYGVHAKTIAKAIVRQREDVQAKRFAQMTSRRRETSKKGRDSIARAIAAGEIKRAPANDPDGSHDSAVRSATRRLEAAIVAGLARRGLRPLDYARSAFAVRTAAR